MIPTIPESWLDHIAYLGIFIVVIICLQRMSLITMRVIGILERMYQSKDKENKS